MILISACLVGVDCRYDGGSKRIDEIEKLVKEGKAILVCPEQLGGLPTPRIPCEIKDGDGSKVLEKGARVLNKEGEDLTDSFVKGAEETLKIAALYGVKKAILKARSPSCGKNRIYDGSFQKLLIDGDGVTAALLKKHGILVLDEEDFREYIEKEY
ncbi:uncharacterized protein YbbK (DUF523 family) [Anaerosolibacter carboniphilus]|uniref:Uncharacterized protein YbbK (DUF523 family) n=1 Tax=Anaerosolibacter carboniphilus TaxID=1417629 RepID=A0A841KX88_9FIRM|nr:DUF523 domain-containing protein [Anaerosolibacter carboniphilus]MBB6218244.1 uncharacterized protein YbbK (DUF523 family) [Anaerosolibacter carboniphilus]